MSQTYNRVNTSTARFIILVAVIIGLGSAWAWWHNIYQNSDRVFWGMVSNNLATSGVTKHDTQTASGQATDQYTQLSFIPAGAVHGVITVKQQGTTVKSETVGDLKTDYSQYKQIQTGQKNSKGMPIDTSKVIGVWGKSDFGQAPQYFQQGVLGVAMFANFNRQQRADLVAKMHNKNVYKISSATSSRLQGRPVFVYDVSISTQGLVSVLSQYAKDIGLGDIGLDDSQYAGSPPLTAQFTVDKISRQLLKVHYTSSNQDETFYSLGLEQSIELPAKTIPVNDLQGRVQQSLQ